MIHLVAVRVRHCGDAFSHFGILRSRKIEMGSAYLNTSVLLFNPMRLQLRLEFCLTDTSLLLTREKITYRWIVYVLLGTFPFIDYCKFKVLTTA